MVAGTVCPEEEVEDLWRWRGGISYCHKEAGRWAKATDGKSLASGWDQVSGSPKARDTA